MAENSIHHKSFDVHGFQRGHTELRRRGVKYRRGNHHRRLYDKGRPRKKEERLRIERKRRSSRNVFFIFPQKGL